MAQHHRLTIVVDTTAVDATMWGPMGYDFGGPYLTRDTKMYPKGVDLVQLETYILDQGQGEVKMSPSSSNGLRCSLRLGLIIVGT